MLPSPWIAHRARHTPDRIALEVSGKRLDYRALHELAAARAADLRSRGLVPGDIVMTGTPHGWLNSRVSVGSRVQHRIEGIGTLEFEIVPRPTRSRGMQSKARSPKSLSA